MKKIPKLKLQIDKNEYWYLNLVIEGTKEWKLHYNMKSQF